MPVDLVDRTEIRRNAYRYKRAFYDSLTCFLIAFTRKFVNVLWLLIGNREVFIAGAVEIRTEECCKFILCFLSFFLYDITKPWILRIEIPKQFIHFHNSSLFPV